MMPDNPNGPAPELDQETIDLLLAAARDASGQAYAPYSKFRVGAALLCADGTVVSGCNVENASFGLTVCAERNAIFAAVVQGAREFVALAVHSPDAPADGAAFTPCGACRQVIHEFHNTLPVICQASDGPVNITTAAELLPGAFELKN